MANVTKSAFDIDEGRLVADLEELACGIVDHNVLVSEIEVKTRLEAGEPRGYTLTINYKMDESMPELRFVYDNDDKY